MKYLVFSLLAIVIGLLLLAFLPTATLAGKPATSWLPEDGV